MDLDELFETEEYLQRAVAAGVPFIPRNPDEVLDAVFGGRLYGTHGGWAWPDERVERFCTEPARFVDDDESEYAEREETDGNARIEAAGARFRDERGREYAVADGTYWNEPTPPEPRPRPRVPDVSVQDRVVGVSPRRFGRVTRPADRRLMAYVDEIQRLRGRVSSARFSLEEVHAAMVRMPALSLYDAARFLRTAAIQQAQTDWFAGRITEQDYRDAIQAAVESYNATTRAPSAYETSEG